MFLADNAGGFTDFASRYLNDVIACVVVGLLVAAMFACMRRWFQLREVNSDYSPSESTRLRFSVFHLLALISFVAVVLSLARGARGEKATDAGIESWQWWAAGGLFVVTFFANTACAALAALGSHAVWRKCLLVLAVAALLGTAIAFSIRQDQVGAIFFAAGVVAMILPTVTVLASLLWLRPCGLRLVRRAQHMGKRSRPVSIAQCHSRGTV